MYQKFALLFLYNETPLQPGSGTGIGDVDQPIQREAHTHLPTGHDSGIKGAFRSDMAEARGIYDLQHRVDQLDDVKKEKLYDFEDVFGPDVGTGREHEHGGALGVSDARILLFPVRSFFGLFAWVTCPFVLQRLRRDLQKVTSSSIESPKSDDASSEAPSLPEAIEAFDSLLGTTPPDPDEAWAGDPSSARNDGKIVLEDFTFTSTTNDESAHVKTIGEWLGENALPQADAYAYVKRRLPRALVVVADEVFRDFTRFSTDVRTRIRIGEDGTVVEGALWNEELLPSDCLLYNLTPAMRSLGQSDMSAEEIIAELTVHLEKHSLLQFGGGKSLTRGLAQVTALRAKIAVSDGPPEQRETSKPPQPTPQNDDHA